MKNSKWKMVIQLIVSILTAVANEEFKMENGDSAHSEHTHRSSNNAGHDFVHGTWTVQFIRKPLPDPSPKREGLFC